ncbi:MAG: hypothetical protein AAGF19_09055, partial [Pseudomonadota bacterium]
MLSPDDVGKSNALGTLDRVVTNIALGMIAIIPTFIVGLVWPRRLAPLIMADQDEGRDGMLLAPGLFFLFSLITLHLAIAIFQPLWAPIAENDTMGSGLAAAVFEAMREGNVWKTAMAMAPIYLFALSASVAGLILRPIAGVEWTLK